MLTVTFRRDSRNRLSSVFAKGHAGWADAGEDVVCAAVSAILQAAWLGLEQHARVSLDASKKKSRRASQLSLRWPENVRDRDDVRAIVATAELSIEIIAREHPDNVTYEREPEP